MTKLDESLGLRDRKKVEVRAALVAAAHKLFAARGFDAVTVDEIAAAADVSRRTFFRYFPTKEAVVLARREDQLEAFRAALSAPSAAHAGDEPAFEAIRRALLALADDYMQKSKRILAEAALVRSSAALTARDLEMDRAYEAAMADALLARGRRSRADQRRARILAAAIVGAVRVTLEEWFVDGGKGDLKRLGDEALDLLAPLAR